ncbi:MAG: SdpA family antimicrobial peptide system protein [Archangium sp.]
MKSQDEARHTRRVGAFMAALLSAVAVLVAYAFHASLPYNALQLPLEKELQVRVILPEGWKFFTREPQEEHHLVFARAQDGTWSRAERGTNASPMNLFGIDREGRAQGVEVGLLLDRVAKSAWQPCTESPAICLEKASLAGRIRNLTPEPTLCGVIGIAMQKPLPWAWNKSAGHLQMPSRVVKLEVTC